MASLIRRIGYGSRRCGRDWARFPVARLVALGTRPAAADHWFSRLLRDADYSQVHATPDPMRRRFCCGAMRRANPSLDFLPSP